MGVAENADTVPSTANSSPSAAMCQRYWLTSRRISDSGIASGSVGKVTGSEGFMSAPLYGSEQAFLDQQGVAGQDGGVEIHALARGSGGVLAQQVNAPFGSQSREASGQGERLLHG